LSEQAVNQTSDILKLTDVTNNAATAPATDGPYGASSLKSSDSKAAKDLDTIGDNEP